MVQQDIVFIWLGGSAFAVSFIVILTCLLGSKFLSLVKSRFVSFAKANLPFSSGSQVKLVQRQLADTWLQWGGPSLFQLAVSLLLGFFFRLYWVAAYWFVVLGGHNEPMLCSDCIGCLRLP
ncbi:hypothetical protein [Vibrio sp. St2]|uniref:hypothetical protein n=1 Tax=Vibrio sp. St2 TaxID=2853441 RepID=UPI00248F3095|nr:hypothetical protein [Vibrio sp. St2]